MLIMNESSCLECDVEKLKDDIESLNDDVIVKIRLADGSIKKIGSVSYNKKEDGILYIEELNLKWVKYAKQVLSFVTWGKKIAENAKWIIHDDEYDDTDFALECHMMVLYEADRWFKKIELKHSIDKGTYSPEEELNLKLDLLEKWVYSY